MEFHQECRHLLEWYGLGQCICSKESQPKPESKVLKKQSKHNIRFDADFDA